MFCYWDASYWSNNGYDLSSDPARSGELSLTNSNNVILAEFVSKIGGNDDYIIVENKSEKKTEKNKREGPLSLNEFKNRKTELLIDKLEFEENFKK